jgi:quinol monooxygenase YgiN
MSIVVILDIKTATDKVDEMKNWMRDNLPDTRARDGAGAMTLLLDQDDPTHIVVHEIWDSKEDHGAYMGWRTERGDMDVLGAMFAAPPGITYLDAGDE